MPPRARWPKRPPKLQIPGKPKSARQWEAELQRDMMRWVRSAVPEDQAIIYHTPNGGKRDRMEAALLKAMGVKAGVPDLTIIGPAPLWIAWAEVKLAKTLWHDRTGLSDEEREFRDKVLAWGHQYAVVRTLGELDTYLRTLGIKPRSRPIDPVIFPRQPNTTQSS